MNKFEIELKKFKDELMENLTEELKAQKDDEIYYYLDNEEVIKNIIDEFDLLSFVEVSEDKTDFKINIDVCELVCNLFENSENAYELGLIGAIECKILEMIESILIDKKEIVKLYI